MAIKKYSVNQLKKMKSKTNLKEVRRKITENDIDFSDLADISNKQIVLATRRGRPLKEERKKLISIRLSVGTLKSLRANGHGWQTLLSNKIDELAKKAL